MSNRWILTSLDGRRTSTFKQVLLTPPSLSARRPFSQACSTGIRGSSIDGAIQDLRKANKLLLFGGLYYPSPEKINNVLDDILSGSPDAVDRLKSRIQSVQSEIDTYEKRIAELKVTAHHLIIPKT